MQESFKRRLIPSQLFIAAAITGAATIGKAPWPVLVALGVIMEVGALLGYAFSASLRKRAAQRENRLPLNRR